MLVSKLGSSCNLDYLAIFAKLGNVPSTSSATSLPRRCEKFRHGQRQLYSFLTKNGVRAASPLDALIAKGLTASGWLAAGFAAARCIDFKKWRSFRYAATDFDFIGVRM